MYTNNSTNSKTLNEQYYKIYDDTWSIDKVLKYVQYQPDLVLTYQNILDDYWDYFAQYLVEIEVDSRYFKRPAMFAEYYYGDPSLYWIVLYFAQIPSMLEFRKRKIKMLPLEKMPELNQIFINNKDKITENHNNPIKF